MNHDEDYEDELKRILRHVPYLEDVVSLHSGDEEGEDLRSLSSLSDIDCIDIEGFDINSETGDEETSNKRPLENVSESSSKKRVQIDEYTELRLINQFEDNLQNPGRPKRVVSFWNMRFESVINGFDFFSHQHREFIHSMIVQAYSDLGDMSILSKYAIKSIAFFASHDTYDGIKSYIEPYFNNNLFNQEIDDWFLSNLIDSIRNLDSKELLTRLFSKKAIKQKKVIDKKQTQHVNKDNINEQIMNFVSEHYTNDRNKRVKLSARKRVKTLWIFANNHYQIISHEASKKLLFAISFHTRREMEDYIAVSTNIQFLHKVKSEYLIELINARIDHYLTMVKGPSKVEERKTITKLISVFRVSPDHVHPYLMKRKKDIVRDSVAV